jgi:hypothetical protein
MLSKSISIKCVVLFLSIEFVFCKIGNLIPMLTERNGEISVLFFSY